RWSPGIPCVTPGTRDSSCWNSPIVCADYRLSVPLDEDPLMSAQTTLESPHQRRTAQPDRPPARPVLVSALVSVSVAGVAWLGAVYAAPESFEVPMAWGAGVAGVVLCAAVVVTAVAVGRARLLQERLVAAAEDATHFAERTVPDLVARLRQGQSAASA